MEKQCYGCFYFKICYRIQNLKFAIQYDPLWITPQPQVIMTQLAGLKDVKI